MSDTPPSSGGSLGAARPIPLDSIDPDPAQPRKEFGEAELAELAGSLGAVGQLQPAIVRRDGERFALIAGERRWRAAKLAGLAELQCVVYDGPTSPRRLALVENVVRADLSPLERARAFQDILDAEGCSASQLARELGISKATVLRSVALLREPPETQKSIIAGRITPRGVRYDEKARRPAWSRVLAGAEGITVTLTAARQPRLQAMALALHQAAGELESDGRGRPRREAA